MTAIVGNEAQRIRIGVDGVGHPAATKQHRGELMPQDGEVTTPKTARFAERQAPHGELFGGTEPSALGHDLARGVEQKSHQHRIDASCVEVAGDRCDVRHQPGQSLAHAARLGRSFPAGAEQLCQCTDRGKAQQRVTIFRVRLFADCACHERVHRERAVVFFRLSRQRLQRGAIAGEGSARDGVFPGVTKDVCERQRNQTGEESAPRRASTPCAENRPHHFLPG